jgi:hypothetical protein
VRAVALDVHRDFCEVAIVADGWLRSAGRIEARPEALELFAQSLDARDWVALEVTGNAWEIARILEPHVARVIVVSPSDTGIRQARAKTDRLDARALAGASVSKERGDMQARPAFRHRGAVRCLNPRETDANCGLSLVAAQRRKHR